MKHELLIKILIVPIMVVSLVGCLIYGDHESGTVVAYANPAVVAVDWFVQALGQLGVSFATVESAREAKKSFSNYLQEEVDTFVNDTVPGLVDIAVNNQDLYISSLKADMAMWNNVFNKGQSINEAKFNSLALRDLQYASDYKVATGSYSALTVFARGWLAKMEKDGHIEDYVDTLVGGSISVNVPVALENTPFYKYVKSQGFYDYMDWKLNVDLHSGVDVNAIINNSVDSLTQSEIDSYATYGSNMYIGILCDDYTKDYYLRVRDVPEEFDIIKISKYSNYFETEFYSNDVRVGVLNSSYAPLENNYCMTDRFRVFSPISHWAFEYSVPFGYSASSARNDFKPIDILSGTLSPAEYNIDNLGSDVDIGDTQIDAINFDMTKISDIDSTADDIIPLDISDTRVVPRPADKVIDKVVADDIEGVVADIDSAIDDTITDTDTISTVVPVPEAGEYAVNLASFFPFCIPFDIYNLLKCLSAEPQAPTIHWELNNFGNAESVDIDLSKFNSIASLMRTLETIAFCVGLGLVTNKLIKH